VRSESAANRVSSSSSEYLTIRFSIQLRAALVNHARQEFLGP
jgi:hypothetical protein